MKASPTRSTSTKAPSPKAPSSKVPSSKISATKIPRIKQGTYVLRLYVAGQTPKCLAAFVNLKTICEEHLAGQYQIEVIDLLENPKLALGDQILAIPTLVRKLPEPVRKIIGDLSNTERVLIGLDMLQRK